MPIAFRAAAGEGGVVQDLPTFVDLCKEELRAIRSRRNGLGLHIGLPGIEEASTDTELRGLANRNGTLGLAISGGGIRSATFALGVLQALAELRLLRYLDYLSTVSGGGYIGSWLLALMYREDSGANGMRSLEESLTPPVSLSGDGPQDVEPRQEHPAIQWLRQYSNYLAPRPALFSADVWNIVTIWIRNTLLNQFTLICLLASILLFARFMVAPFPIFPAAGNDSSGGSKIWFAIASALFIVTVFLMSRTVRSLAQGTRVGSDTAVSAQWKAFSTALALYLSAYFASASIWWIPSHPDWSMARMAAIVMGVCSAFASYCSAKRTLGWFPKLISALVASVLATVVFVSVALIVGQVFEGWVGSEAGGNFRAMIIGPTVILLVFGLQVILILGLMGRFMDDMVREWWSRVGAYMTIVAAVPAAMALIAVYGPLLAMWIWNSTVLSSTITLGWIGTTLTGVIAGWSSKTNGTPVARSKILEYIAPLAPPVFVLGLLLIVSTGVDQLMVSGLKAAECRVTTQRGPTWEQLSGPNFFSREGVVALGALEGGDPKSPAASIRSAYLRRLQAQPSSLFFFVSMLFLAVGAAAGLIIDINQFSMHNFYRHRLVRGYLGASRRRRDADPLTNFSEDDDLPLHKLRFDNPAKNFLGPVPIINGALNLANPEQGKQERKATSFVFGPYCCGYELKDEEGNPKPAYRPTGPPSGAAAEAEYFAMKDNGGVSLGQVLTISGAAASPNMGFHTSAPLAFLMTMFNVRLGWWLPNPRRKKWTARGPGFGIAPLITELLAQANDQRSYVYVSDGGHFENLAIYELLRRRCRYIICSDGEEDGRFEFPSLGGLIRKARADFGIEIDIDTSSISKRNASGHSEQHCAVGTIWYPEPGLRGTLLYFKAAVTGDEPGDILQYQLANREFPHQTTGDQFFSESQFESYRRLGYHVAMSAFLPVRAQGGALPHCVGDREAVDTRNLFTGLQQAWGAAPRYTAAQFTGLTQRLDEQMERLRTDDELAFLRVQIFPQWGQVRGGEQSKWWPMEEQAFARAFLFCLSLIQLMEDVYTTLDMEAHHSHPDCAGWMNLYRHLAGSDMFRLTYAITSCTFGGRFRSFIDRRIRLMPLKLELGAAENLSLFLSGSGMMSRYQYNEYEEQLMSQLARDASEHVKVRPVLVMVNPVFKERVDHLSDPWVRLTVGFVLVDLTPGQPHSVRWIRIQNHLRRMGLGRQALESLPAHEYAFAPMERPADEMEWWEVDSASHVRWASTVVTWARRIPPHSIV